MPRRQVMLSRASSRTGVPHRRRWPDRRPLAMLGVARSRERGQRAARRLLPAPGGIFESQHHGVSLFFFFFSHTELGRFMSSQTFHEFLFCSSHFLGRKKKKFIFSSQVRLFHTGCLRSI